MMTERDPALDWLVRDLRSHLRKKPKRHQLSDAARYAFNLYDTNTATLPSADMACKAGCGSCCCSQVGAEMAEAFAILRHLQETSSTEDFEKVMGRVAELAREVGTLDPGARWELQKPCVFLDPQSQSCTIYAVRPIACRGYNSLDLNACNLSTQNLDHSQPIPADGERMVRAHQLRQALAEVTGKLMGRDQSVEHLELHLALVSAQQSGTELAWLMACKRGKT